MVLKMKTACRSPGTCRACSAPSASTWRSTPGNWRRPSTRARRPSWTPAPGWGSLPGTGIRAASWWTWSISRWRRGSPARRRSWPIHPSRSSTKASSPSMTSSSGPTSWCGPGEPLAADRGEVHRPGEAGAPRRPRHPGVCAHRRRPQARRVCLMHLNTGYVYPGGLVGPHTTLSRSGSHPGGGRPTGGHPGAAGRDASRPGCYVPTRDRAG